MSRTDEDTGFICENCGQVVFPVGRGTYRNHCPFCLFSKHVDVTPGDRLSLCTGLMRPTGVISKAGKGLQITHTCLLCGVHRVNRIADGPIQPDDMDQIVALARGGPPVQRWVSMKQVQNT
jgi:hypothetical protein